MSAIVKVLMPSGCSVTLSKTGGRKAIERLVRRVCTVDGKVLPEYRYDQETPRSVGTGPLTLPPLFVTQSEAERIVRRLCLAADQRPVTGGG